MLEFDRDHLWHPYTSISQPLPVYPVASTQGVRIELTDERSLIDGMSSWWCAIHGYNHPRLNQALTQQVEKMSHIMFGGITHQGAVDLAQALIDMTAAPLQHVFLCDSGSVSVEVAIKMAIQYWYATGKSDKHKLVTFRGGYHGDTFGAMAVCDPVSGMHGVFSHTLAQNFFLDRPSARFGEAAHEDELKAIEEFFEQKADQIAAFIVEPVVQGAGGMWFYSAEHLKRVVELCRQHEVLVIFDEIATGFGRTGKLFAYEHVGVVPDILCLGKALTGGYLSMAATVTQKHIDQGISQNGGILAHGPTFMGNPLACSVANESLKLLQENSWQTQIKSIESQLQMELSIYQDHPAVKEVRVLGAIGVVETHQPVPVAHLQAIFVEQGVWIRPFNNLIYLMPPYIIQPDELSQLTQSIAQALDQL